MCTNQDILAITPDKTRLDPRFLLFVLKGRSAEILRDGIKTGVTVQSFHNGFFKAFEIPLPPLEEQRRILAEIEGYQKVLDGARQILAGYSPVFDADSEWARKAMGQLAQFEYGHTATAADSGAARYVRITDIDERGTLRLNGAKFTELTPEATTCLLRPGDILVTRIGATYGKTLYFDSPETAVFASYLIRVTFNANSGVLPKFYWYFTKTLDYQQQRDQLVSGGGQPQFNANALKELEIPVPPLEEQRRIVAELDAEEAQMEAVRPLLPRFEAKIQGVLDRVWGNDGTQ